ncbi:MAG: ABC transporter substrate-binding protein, partial [Candidatus Caldarchaeum sp.]|nr:ABC transporter substrate-binding protein [Candidatus Caldarchaeum sp.]MDW8435409.1 ABC transporter substrate-binding protein [Candidatus Caldarchaeum sp.]
MSENKSSRRGFLSAVAAGVAGAIIGAGVGWSARTPETREITRVATVTVPGAGERTVTVTQPGPGTTVTVTNTVTREVTAVRRLPRDTVKIGILGIRSGPWATYGTFIEQGARMAVDEINAAGGIL